MQDDIPLDSIEGTDDDVIDPQSANANEGSLFSGGDPDDVDLTESVDDEDSDDEE